MPARPSLRLRAEGSQAFWNRTVGPAQEESVGSWIRGQCLAYQTGEQAGLPRG